MAPNNKNTFISTLVILLLIANIFVIIPSKGENIEINNPKIKSMSDPSWDQINKDGFGQIENVGPRGIEIFNGSLVIATANYNNNSTIALGETYEINDFFETFNTVGRFENGLLSNGCEIWAYNGTIWKPLVANNESALMPEGFGNKNNSEIGFLKVFKGQLYAGVRNRFEGCQIWRTKSINNTWEKVADDGFETKNNTGAWTAEEFNGYLYVGTINWEWDGVNGGCELYRSFEGENWTAVVGGNSSIPSGFMMPEGFGMNFYLWSMANYSGYLYAGTSFPGDIWRSSDGISWEPFVAYDSTLEAIKNGAKYPRHFGKYYVGGIRRMQVYKDELYIFSAQNYGKTRILVEGLGNTISKISSLINFIRTGYDSLKYYLAGTQIWKFNSTTDRWIRVVGGFGKQNSSAGFGDLQNIYLWSATADENYLYVGTSHPNSADFTITRNSFKNWSICMEKTRGHGQIWRYDSKNWECLVGEDKGLEFEDEYNVGFRELILYKNSLIGSTMNVNTGCEVWEIQN